jgi:ATP-binding protein involved in chromosome partitioning
MGELNKENIKQVLKSVKDISGENNIVEADRIEKIAIDGNSVMLTLSLPTEDGDVRRRIEEETRSAVKGIGDVAGVMIMIKGPQREAEAADAQQAPPPHDPMDARTPIEGVKNIVAVSSAKGGVGKSTVCVNLALALQKSGAKVGLVDVDVYGPSVHILLDVMERPQPGVNKEIAPVEKDGLKIMSLGFLLEKRSPVIWRGPMVMSVVQRFLQDVDWGELDFLLVDTPPGTGDAQLTLVQTVPLTGAVIITTPSELALVDAEKGLQMFRTVSVPVLGIIENMSHFTCPHCENKTEIFGPSSGAGISERLDTEFLGTIPLDVQVRAEGDRGRPVVKSDVDSPVTKAFIDIAARISEKCPTAV